MNKLKACSCAETATGAKQVEELLGRLEPVIIELDPVSLYRYYGTGSSMSGANRGATTETTITST